MKNRNGKRKAIHRASALLLGLMLIFTMGGGKLLCYRKLRARS